jgi:serine/threonine-protein kinase
MSPEQALGRKLDHRSDVFSLGSCLYEMLTRIPPFTATNEMDLLIKVRDAKYRPISELQPGIPPELEAITDKCLTRSRANRYQTAAEAEGDLRAFLRKFMPNYSRSHLGRFIRKMFSSEIERELRMLEEFVMADEPSDDVGESLMVRDDFEPPEVPFQPKPTSVSVAIAPHNDFSGDSNFTTMPKVDSEGRRIESHSEDIHQQNTMILDGRGRHSSPPAPSKRQQQPTARGRTQPPPIPQQARKPSGVKPIYDEELHAAPTMIIDINRMRRSRGRG